MVILISEYLIESNKPFFIDAIPNRPFFYRRIFIIFLLLAKTFCRFFLRNADFSDIKDERIIYKKSFSTE